MSKVWWEQQLAECIVSENSQAVAEPGHFPWALIQMKAGKKVTRGFDVCFMLGDGFSCCAMDGTHLMETSFSNDDLLATDWRLYEGEEG